MDDYVKKNFNCYDRVKIVNFPEDNENNGRLGTVVGCSFVDIINHYIVILDDEIERFDWVENISKRWRAVSITEVCLEKV